MPQMITASVWNFIHGVLNGMFRRIEGIGIGIEEKDNLISLNAR